MIGDRLRAAIPFFGARGFRRDTDPLQRAEVDRVERATHLERCVSTAGFGCALKKQSGRGDIAAGHELAAARQQPGGIDAASKRACRFELGVDFSLLARVDRGQAARFLLGLACGVGFDSPPLVLLNAPRCVRLRLPLDIRFGFALRFELCKASCLVLGFASCIHLSKAAGFGFRLLTRLGLSALTGCLLGLATCLEFSKAACLCLSFLARLQLGKTAGFGFDQATRFLLRGAQLLFGCLPACLCVGHAALMFFDLAFLFGVGAAARIFLSQTTDFGLGCLAGLLIGLAAGLGFRCRACLSSGFFSRIQG